ncbi:MAG: hypothetical protein HC788_06185 [Sphingopyxis sp.]|nr:hypothetical protein [Sphingopyxis sp.]
MAGLAMAALALHDAAMPCEIADLLTQVMTRAMRSGPIANLTRLSGGASMESWAFDWGDAGYVLRRAPSRTPRGRLPRRSAPAGTTTATSATSRSTWVPLPAHRSARDFARR